MEPIRKTFSRPRNYFCITAYGRQAKSKISG
jgi:hypothetical protein